MTLSVQRQIFISCFSVITSVYNDSFLALLLCLSRAEHSHQVKHPCCASLKWFLLSGEPKKNLFINPVNRKRDLRNGWVVNYRQKRRASLAYERTVHLVDPGLFKWFDSDQVLTEVNVFLNMYEADVLTAICVNYLCTVSVPRNPLSVQTTAVLDSFILTYELLTLTADLLLCDCGSLHTVIYALYCCPWSIMCTVSI